MDLVRVSNAGMRSRRSSPIVLTIDTDQISALTRFLEHALFEVRATDPGVAAAVSLLLVAVIPLVAQLLFSIWQPRNWRRGGEVAEPETTEKTEMT